jgi:hypothetical protein
LVTPKAMLKCLDARYWHKAPLRLLHQFKIYCISSGAAGSQFSHTGTHTQTKPMIKLRLWWRRQYSYVKDPTYQGSQFQRRIVTLSSRAVISFSVHYYTCNFMATTVNLFTLTMSCKNLTFAKPPNLLTVIKSCDLSRSFNKTNYTFQHFPTPYL